LGWIAGTQYLPAGVSSLVAASMEPVLASSVAWILLDERLNLYQILGAFITIACVVMLGYFDLEQERKVIKGFSDDLPQMR
jgi:drug/metabolite transporter (DMT)-like permease